MCQASFVCFVGQSGGPVIHANSPPETLHLACKTTWQTSWQLKIPSITHTHTHTSAHAPQSAIIRVRQSSTKAVGHSLNHLQVVRQVRRPLSLGRYQPPTRSWCIPSTGHSELSDRSAKQRDLHLARGQACRLFILHCKKHPLIDL